MHSYGRAFINQKMYGISTRKNHWINQHWQCISDNSESMWMFVHSWWFMHFECINKIQVSEIHALYFIHECKYSPEFIWKATIFLRNLTAQKNTGLKMANSSASVVWLNNDCIMFTHEKFNDCFYQYFFLWSTFNQWPPIIAKPKKNQILFTLIKIPNLINTFKNCICMFELVRNWWGLWKKLWISVPSWGKLVQWISFRQCGS